MKQIDRLLVVSFVGPFAVAFGIALFAFLMQYLWVYIDEIIGKGAGPLLIAELVGYLSVSLMPMALPVAVLIASVMTMGNLAEHYELASMKSAGVPLLRVMAPLAVCCLGIAAFSFACSNYLIPVANLKARTRLYDIRKQKPSLSLEEGAFNDDFQGFSIRIGKKDADDRGLEDVMLFRQGGNLRGRLESVNALRGRMDLTPDERYFVLELDDGFQYQEPEPEAGAKRRTYPFVRTKFATYRKSFDLSEFEIDRTDESAFESHQNMLSAAQLAVAADSIRDAMAERRGRLGEETGRFITPLRERDRAARNDEGSRRRDSLQLAHDLEAAGASKTLAQRRDSAGGRGGRFNVSPTAAGAGAGLNSPSAPRPRPTVGREIVEVEASDYVSYINDQPEHKRASYTDRALQFTRSIVSYAEGAHRRLDSQRDSLVRHVYERHAKYSFSMACFVFLFIGAPMGAIIRKGGFGYPILVSIIFFMVFIVLTIMCKKLMESYTLQPGLAAWTPTLSIFPIGVILTIKAMNDQSFALTERIQAAGKWVWARLSRQRAGGAAA